jgi:LytS/YehU family sensor histidine kinase
MGLEFNSVSISLFKASLNVFLLILLAYVNSNILVPKLFIPKRISFYILSVIGLIALYVFISKEITFSNSSDIRITIQQLRSGKSKVTNAWMLLKLVSIVLSTIVLFVSTAFALIQEIYLQNKQKMEVEIENKTAELKLIITQLSPHFFLNSLNNLYSISKLKPEKTAAYIERLTSLMQYVTYEQMNEKIILKKEIDFIKNYIYFQKEKGDDLFNVTTDFEDADQNLPIEPRLFIPFVENAFKYAYQPNKTMNVSISIKTDNDRLYFTVTNDISTLQRRSKEDGYFGVGINSVKKILVNLYPQRQELNITKTEKRYSVELILKLRNE